MRPLSNFAARDVETLLHPTTNLLAHRSLGPLVLERGEGIYVYDTAGKRYIEGRFDILVTLDRNLVYQQKVVGRPISVVVLSIVDQTPEAFRTLVPALIDALGEVQPGEVRQVSL